MLYLSTLKTTRKLFILAILIGGLLANSYAQNAIVQENQLAGTPQSEWNANDNGDIEGFAQEFSVNKGDTVHFKIDINSSNTLPYTVKIYRLGYYNGNGARLIADLGDTFSGSLQPAPNYDSATGKVDCSNWAVSASWAVPGDAVSGVYMARLNCPYFNEASNSTILLFIVRDDNANSPVLFKTSDATWQAYNTYGGNSFYDAMIPVPGFTHATKASYQRPVHLRGDKSGFFNAEYPMLKWLEKNGYDLTYASDMDMARNAASFTPTIHKVLLSVGHDEYWSAEQRAKFENARANGVHLAFFSGNEVYWKTRWEDNYQTLVCYKEGTQGEYACGTKCDPLPNTWTGLWREGCSPTYAINDGCRPEVSLSGQMSWSQSTGSIKVPDMYKNLRFWKNTSVASLAPGQTSLLPYGTLGNEWDPEQVSAFYPSHRVILSNTVQSGFTHKMSLYRHSSGSLVFGAGTMQWAWGLDTAHDLNSAAGPVQAVSADMQQATVNLLHYMEATPGSIQANLVEPSDAPDLLAPSTVIVSPIHLSTVQGASITISGNSADNGNGAIGGVEVSLDNGVTWNTASGLENWTYTFTPTALGTITIKVRAWDDLGNLEIPGNPGSANCIQVTFTGPFVYSVFNASYPATEPFFFTGQPVELGMKFRTSVTGNIKGFRYYKGPGVTGTHIGHLWSSAGVMLAEATFTNESASGWQSVSLQTPVPIDVNTTYTVSYFTSSGDFIKQDPFFNQPVVNGFLRGLANGEEGGNGVYNYGPVPGYPQDNYGSSNYYADVIFETNDFTPPAVITVFPAINSHGNGLDVKPFAKFSESLDPTTVSGLTVTLTGPGSININGVVSLTRDSLVTFTPDSDLVPGSTYTFTLKGGLNEQVIKDLIGNPLPGDFSYSFKIGSLSAPLVITKPTSITACSNSIVSFNSVATGIPSPSVQWQKSINNGGTWDDIPGANSGTYTFVAAYADNNNQYRARWSNSQGTDYSLPAILTVAEPIDAVISAVNSTICPGEPVQLQLSSATGSSPFTLNINSSVYQGITVGQSFSALLNDETMWPSSNIPQEFFVLDTNSVELGIKFTSSKKGIIKGIRFFKGSPLNGGQHTGSLWSQSGSLLASANFTNETTIGWQEVLFSTPVQIEPNVTYVASYYAPNGYYSRDGSYFLYSHTNGNSLTAIQNSAAEPNAVYRYDSQSSFPDQNYGDPNYWVDIVFSAYDTSSTTFNLTQVTGSNNCSTSGNPISSVTITKGTAVNAGNISGVSNLCIGGSTSMTTDGDPGGIWASSNTAVATINSAGEVTALSAGTTNITYTLNAVCGIPVSTKSVTVNPDAHAGVVTGVSHLCKDATAPFTSDGDLGGNWSSSDTNIAVVNQAGIVTALSNGTVNIIYTVMNGCNNSIASVASLTVDPNVNAGTLTGASPLCIGAPVTYFSTGTSGGIWSSTDPLVASVNSTGMVMGLMAGTTDITYSINAGCGSPVSAVKTLTINPNVTAGTVTGASPLCIGVSSNYSSSGTAGGVWSSSNTSVASVGVSGLVKTFSAGTATITYKVNSGCNSPVTAIKVLTVNPTVNEGKVTGPSPLCIGVNATYITSGTPGGAWSSSNPAIATINTSGLVTALAAGVTNIIYTVSAVCGGTVSSFLPLTVNQNVDAGVISGLSPLCIGSANTYISSGTPGGTWSSSNPAVATVSPAGLVTALAAGTTNITYTVNTGCGGPVSSMKILTVNQNVSAGNIAGTSPLCIGSANVYSSDGTAGGSWSSSNTAVATVSPVGLVTALAAGTINITYTVSTGCGSPVSSMKILTVNPNVSAGIINGASPVCIGSANTYTSNGTAGGSWASSNPAVASVSPVGLVTALAAGTTNISYTVSTGCGGPVSSMKILTVNQNVIAGIITGASPVCIGSANTYTSDGTAGGSWASSNPAVASVSPSGLVTALAAGITNISYTVNTGCGGPVSSMKILTVNQNVSAGIITGASLVCIGSANTYTSNGTSGGTWSSSNIAVATVSPAGLVTALSAGTTNIIYTVSAGCGGPVSTFKILTVSQNVSGGTISGNSPVCIGSANTYTSNGTTGGTWSSSNTAVASVSPAGSVTALSAGTTNIIYTVSAGCGGPVSTFKTLTVSQNVSGGTVSGNSPVCIGSANTFTCNGTPGGVWSSTNPVVASVSPVGVVTALSSGTTNIKYSVNTGCGGPVSSLKVLTVSQNVTGGTISGNSPICIGSATAFTSNGTLGGVWSSSNPSVATVSPAGSVTALTSGTTNIVYTVSTGCGGPVSSSKPLTVNPNVTAGTVSGASSLCMGLTTLFTSTGVAGGTWSSSNPLVASVNASGLVTAINAGTTNITYNISSGCGAPLSSFKTFIVNNKKPVVICKPFTVALSATGTASIAPANINNGSYSNCSAVTLTVSPSIFNCTNIGINNVTLYARDIYGNIDSCKTTVTVTGGPLYKYVMIASREVRLQNSNVRTGGIGITTTTGGANISQNSTVTAAGTFIESNNINVNSNSFVTARLPYNPAIPLPAFESSLLISNNDITVANGATVVLTDSLYNNIKVGKFSTVIINSPVMNVRSLQLKEYAIIKFNQCTNIRVKEEVKMNRGVQFNPDGFEVKVFSMKDVNIRQGAKIKALIFAKDKDINVDGRPNNRTQMSGLFIASTISCDKGFIDWDLGKQCGKCSVNNLLDAKIVSSTDVSCDGETTGSATAGATGGVPPYTYLWDNGSTQATRNNLGVGSYRVIVTDAVGTKDTVIAEIIVFTYTLLASNEIYIGRTDTVYSGSMGITGNTGKATIDWNSGVMNPLSLVIAPLININNGSTVENPVYGVATVTLPRFEGNINYSTWNDLFVPNNTTMILGANDTLFRRVTVGSNATLVITSSVCNVMDNLVLRKNSILKFNQCTKLRVKFDLQTEENIVINPTNMPVVFHVNRNVSINQGSNVQATIYAPNGSIQTLNSLSSAPTVMKGKFSATRILGGDYTNWYENTSCPCAGPLGFAGKSRSSFTTPETQTDEIKTVTDKMEVMVYPNPAPKEFTIRVNSGSSEPVNVRITDITGIVRETMMNVSHGKTFTIGRKLPGGTYFAEITQGNQKQLVKIIRLN